MKWKQCLQILLCLLLSQTVAANELRYLFTCFPIFFADTSDPRYFEQYDKHLDKKTPEELVAFFSEIPPIVKYVHLGENNLGVHTIGVLKSALHFIPKDTVEFNFCANHLDNLQQDFATLIEQLPPQLKELNLNLNHLGLLSGDTLEIAFAHLPTTIETLSLWDNQLELLTGQALGKLLKNLPPKVTTAKLALNRFGEMSPEDLHLGLSQLPPTVSSIEFSIGNLELMSEKNLQFALAGIPEHIEEVDIYPENNYLRENEGRPYAHFFHALPPHIKTVIPHSGRFLFMPVEDIVTALEALPASVMHFNMSSAAGFNRDSEETPLAIFNALPRTLNELSLNNALMDIDYYQYSFSRALKTLPPLKKLNLIGNYLGYVKTENLTDLISGLPHQLKILDLRFNDIGVKSLEELMQIFGPYAAHNPHLKLILDSEGLDDEKIQLLGNMGFELEIKQTSPNSGQGLKSHAP